MYTRRYHSTRSDASSTPRRVYRKARSHSKAPPTRTEVAKIAKQVLYKNSETKYFYVNSGTTAVNFLAAGSLFPLAQIAQGTSDSTRTGDQIRLEHLRLAIRLVGQTSNIPTTIRMIIFLYKPLATASLPTAGSLVYDSLGQDYQSSMSALDPKNAPMFTILRDTYFTTVNPYVNSPVAHILNINLRNSEQVYTGDTYSTNGLYMLLINMGFSSASTYVYNSQVAYRDI